MNEDAAHRVRRGYVHFPEHWDHVRSDGVAGFVTRVIHKLPDGGLHIWTSRRHRKGRGPVRVSRDRVMPGDIRSYGLHPDNDEYHHGNDVDWTRTIWGWKFNSTAWWVAFVFTFGSVLFVAGAVPAMFMTGFFIGALYFAGSVCFTIASYLALMEVNNASLDGEIRNDVTVVVDFLLGRRDRTHLQRIAWLTWQPHRLDWWAASVQMVGALIFNVNCYNGMFHITPWWWADLIVWTPSTLGSLCFVTAGLLAYWEVTHTWLAWRPKSLEWWICACNVLGAVGFLLSSLTGYFAQGPVQINQEWTTNFLLMGGCFWFLGGSYLLIPESLDDNTSH